MIKVSTRSDSSEASLLRLQMATFPLNPHVVSSLAKCHLVSSSLLTRTPSYWIRTHPYDLIFLTYLSKGPLSNDRHSLRPWELRVQYMNFKGTQFSP